MGISTECMVGLSEMRSPMYELNHFLFDAHRASGWRANLEDDSGNVDEGIINSTGLKPLRYTRERSGATPYRWEFFCHFWRATFYDGSG